MSEEEKLLWMFKQVHGEITGSCYLEVQQYDGCEELDEPIVKVMKDGNLCWEASRSKLTFDYITKDL